MALDLLLEKIEAGASFSCEERPPTTDEVGVLKVSAVTWGDYNEDESKTCTNPDRIHPDLFVSPDDFLFSRANTINLVGACVIARHVTRRIMLSDKVLRLRLVGTPQEWVLHLLRSDWGRQEIERLATGNQESMRNIGQGRIRQIRIPMPPSDEVAYALEAMTGALSRVDRLASHFAQQETHFSTLDQSILAKAFRGELVPQDPNDEPASVLLERIRAAREAAPSTPTRRGRKPKAGSQAPTPAKPPRQPKRSKAAQTAAPTTPEPPQQPDPEPLHRPAQLSLDLDTVDLESELFAALWLRGPLDKDDAVRAVAEHLRERKLVSFQRLRKDGSLYAELLAAIEAAVKAGPLDRPKRGQVRACKHSASEYTIDDWREALVRSLGQEPVHQEDAVAQAAEWARDMLGLEFKRLRTDGKIAEGVRSAINSAIRRGLVVREGRKVKLA